MNPILLTADPQRRVVRMDLSPQLADEVGGLFSDAANEFGRDIEAEIDFDAGYQLADGECFQISDFAIPGELLSACQQPLSCDRLAASEIPTLRIKSIVGYDITADHSRLFFQNFDSRRVIVPGKRFALLSIADTSTFQHLQQPVVLLDARLAAIWQDGVLKFKSFHLARQIFDLSDYFAEATAEQLVQFAGHQRMLCQNQEEFVSSCSQANKKKIALILNGGMLENVTAGALREAATAVGYNLAMDGERILLPSDKGAIRALLQFLDEDFYLGPISQRKLLSSGKRVRK